MTLRGGERERDENEKKWEKKKDREKVKEQYRWQKGESSREEEAGRDIGTEIERR